MSSGDGRSAFAVAAPGLEPFVVRELAAMGVRAVAEPGGAAFGATTEELYRANLWSRLVSRIIVRVASFRVRALGELARRAGGIPWEEWLSPGVTLRVRATARKSRLYHTGAITERILDGIAARVPVHAAAAVGDADSDDERDDAGEQLLIVRLWRDECAISLDSSGALLHRRGYRQAVAKAPLRETLAAGMLVAGGWRAADALADPFCGAGTIPIEAAMLARDMAPGANRAFAFERWPRHDGARWNALRDEAAGRVRASATAPIFASDRDPGAVAATHENARRAGVDGDLQVTHASLSAAPLGHAGWIVTNPPYGVRVGDPAALRDLYATLGRVVRDGGHRLIILSADADLERQLRVPLETVLATSNGGIPVRVRRSPSPADSGGELS